MYDKEFALDMAAIVREHVALEVGKLRAELVAARAEVAGLKGQVAVLKELFVREEKMPDLIFPGESHARTRSLS